MFVKVTKNRRITIPAKISRKLNIREGDIMEVRVEGDSIIPRKVKRIESLAGAWKDAPVEEFISEIKKRWNHWKSSA